MLTRMIIVLGLAAVFGWGCSDEPASLARVSLDRDTLFVPAMLHVRLADGHSTWTFGPEDLGLDARYAAQWWTPEVATENSGTLSMAFWFLSPEGDTVSAGEVSMPLRDDWRWHIGIHGAAGRRYFQGCFGCSGAEPFEIRVPAYATTDSDSVWVIWGGNSISHPVIY